ncbi:PhnB protein [Saccharopolyspora kobensis]|uniref:PhnB protein n=1 Tax=Saccharopolyspora kobensis TaxID=146035 RepID=A0A1H6D9X9_9PSEU|nr:VOC family protein [Saccharopolyspora kobensis]SEG82287.1 PhnB protein [Saccharopolyspora kobensis]SFE24020.1 PhnB protein [Saccharopolyspora kobensis]
MGSQVNPCITFNGNARQAVEFYREVFGGELELRTVADFGSPDSPNADKVMHSRLDTPAGYTLMAWDHPDDRPGHPPYRPGNNVAIFLDGDDLGLRDYFEKLSVGGTVTLPLEKQVWGDEAGSLVDQFGISWMFNITTRNR